jgi:hypothetical protein
MKRKRTSILVGTFLLALLLALATGIATVAYAAGTGLSITFGDATIVCKGDGSGANVSFQWTATSTGAADAATVTGQIDGGTIFSLPGIAAGNVTTGGGWTFAGRIKTADGSYSTVLPNGTHTFTVCTTQKGVNGNPDKSSCTTQTVVVNCLSTDACANAQVFGEVPANKNLCLANGHIEVQFSGNFGDPASLEIDGPNESGFSRTDLVNRAGDSCNYHFNWDPHDSQGNGGAGTYTFKVTGNNQASLVVSETLDCTVHGSN